ncbi:uncharacterized protein LOC121981440 isoform X2 [Zingiber officinale]|uniref:uncharacterized protein LOC121981440 isoform X2 n=1 Tax=Zingiber officinale TaxID=94328 RepID=UPI001C4A7A18|nr:uncharacterized protein LOC121981440 isoform X2 [Zingiber officinale]
MLESFFAARSSQCSVTEAVPPITLLSGPRSCGKTSILFQFAINRARESRGNVVFICNKRRLEYKPPFLSQDGDPSADVLERIEMKYIEDYNGMMKYFAAFHLHKTFPAAIVIDDFEDHFIDRTCKQRYGNARGRDLAMARCLALCRDAILHANQKLEDQASCKLLLADTHQGDNPRLLFIYKRWVHCILTIHGDVNGFFILKNSNVSSNALETRRARYSIALQSLLLEAILESSAKSDEQSLPVVR